jgi:hypothetical protein
MSTFVKIVIGLVAAITLSCAAGAAIIGWSGWKAYQAVSTNAEQAEQIAAGIAGFDLPNGYQSQYGLRVLGIELAAYASDNPRTHLFLAQAGPNSGIGVEEIENIVKQADEKLNQRSPEARVTAISKEDVTVRGKPAIRLVSEGTSSEGYAYRQITLFFEGKGGPAMASITAPAADWDESEYAGFIASIH